MRHFSTSSHMKIRWILYKKLPFDTERIFCCFDVICKMSNFKVKCRILYFQSNKKDVTVWVKKCLTDLLFHTTNGPTFRAVLTLFHPSISSFTCNRHTAQHYIAKRQDSGNSVGWTNHDCCLAKFVYTSILAFFLGIESLVQHNVSYTYTIHVDYLHAKFSLRSNIFWDNNYRVANQHRIVFSRNWTFSCIFDSRSQQLVDIFWLIAMLNCDRL